VLVVQGSGLLRSFLSGDCQHADNLQVQRQLGTDRADVPPHCLQESEPEIWNAIRFGAILENVVFDEYTREVDFMSKCAAMCC
jgi:Phosphoenolpyruvate carboxykinase